MAWNIGMAVISKAAVEDVVATLDLQPLPANADVRVQLPLGDAIDHRDELWGIGKLGEVTIVTSKAVVAHETLWKRLSVDRTVLVFYLAEGIGDNCLYIYEDGDRVVRREEKKGSREWKPSHRFENRARKKKPDYIADVFKNMTGVKLAESMDAIVEMRVMPAPFVEPIETFRARFDRKLAEPQPREGEWVSMGWFNRWFELEYVLDRAWERDPAQVVESWIPRLLDDMTTWPDRERTLEWDRFDMIAKGRDDGRYTEFAPLYRHFALQKEHGRKTEWRPKPFAKFFEHPITSQLTLLDCGFTWMPPELGSLIAASPRLENVRALSFDRSSLGNKGLELFASATNLKALRSLNLFGTEIDRDGLPALFDAPFAHQLEHLNLGSNKLDGTDLQTVRERLPGLVTLTTGVVEL